MKKVVMCIAVLICLTMSCATTVLASKPIQTKELFVCDICGKLFSSRSSLTSHLLTHAFPSPSYKCPLCGAKFSSEQDLLKHRLGHN